MRAYLVRLVHQHIGQHKTARRLKDINDRICRIRRRSRKAYAAVEQHEQRLRHCPLTEQHLAGFHFRQVTIIGYMLQAVSVELGKTGRFAALSLSTTSSRYGSSCASDGSKIRN